MSTKPGQPQSTEVRGRGPFPVPGCATLRRLWFRHLSELPKSVTVGRRVVGGEVLAQSGNTGHSFAPHLHYQLMLGEAKVLDPFDVHDSYRRSISPTDLGALQAEMKRLDALFPTAVATATP